MPIESSETRIPEEALNAFLDGLLAELKSPADPATLDKVRSAFRKRVPLHRRSYAAALLIMRAAGMTRTPHAKAPLPAKAPAPAKVPAAKLPPAKSAAQAPAQVKASAPSEKKPAHSKAGPSEPTARQSKRKAIEGAVPLFISMGKRQRLKPQELRDLISEKTGIAEEDLGRVNLFDNYSFIDVKDTDAERILSACAGLEIKGRTVEIQLAKKKGEAAAEPAVQVKDSDNEGAKPE